MRKVIRILQVHNLAISPGRKENPLSTLFDDRELRELMNKIDYLVVCGNFTRDLSAKSFAQASRVLGEMARKFLPFESRANRVILVPGPADVPNPNEEHPDFTAFRQFYRAFYRDELDAKKRFDSHRAELRELKDLTLIGLTYWNSTDPDVSHNRTRAFGEALDKAIHSPSSLAYVNATPTLLVSAETPLFSNGQQLPSHPGENVFNPDLKIAFHLFGAGPLENVAPGPFSYNHVSLGLGSGDLWASRVNLVELDGEPTTDRRLGAKWTALRKRAGGEDWEKRVYLGGFEAEVGPGLEPEFEKLYHEFLEQLTRAVFKEDTQMIHVQGFPGSGIQEVFSLLRGDSLKGEKLLNLGGHQVCIHGHRWIDESKLREFLKKLSSPDTAAVECVAHLIVLYHPKFYQIPREARKEHIENILDSCQTLFYQDKPFKLLYLTGFADSRFSVAGRDELRFLALNEARAIPDLLQHYVYRVPLYSSQVTDLTGGYAGFSQRFLHRCEDNFSKNWDGARDIDSWTSAILLRDSFTEGKVPETCHRFLECVKEIGDGPKVFDYVRKQVLGHYEKARIGGSASFGRIEVEGLSDHSETWKHMANYQVLDRIGKSNRYRVRVVAPFLGRRSATVFFSYFSGDTEYVQRAKSLLEELGKKEKTELRIFEYQDKHRTFEEAASLKDELAKELAKARNFCIFQLARGMTEMVEYEIEFWAKTWGWPAKNCRRIVLVPYYNSPLPTVLQGTKNSVIPVKERTIEDVVGELFRRLESEEMEWGFKLKETGLQAYAEERTGGR